MFCHVNCQKIRAINEAWSFEAFAYYFVKSSETTNATNKKYIKIKNKKFVYFNTEKCKFTFLHLVNSLHRIFYLPTFMVDWLPIGANSERNWYKTPVI